MCFDVMTFKVGDEIRQHECQDLNGDQAFAYMRNKRIMPQAEQCLGVGHGIDAHGVKRKSIVLEHCSVHDNDEYMQWDFDEEVKETTRSVECVTLDLLFFLNKIKTNEHFFIQNQLLSNIALDLCVTGAGVHLYLEPCDSSNDKQQWMMKSL